MTSSVEVSAYLPDISSLFWGPVSALYEALEDSQIEAERLRKVFLDFAPLPPPGQIVFLGDRYQSPVLPIRRDNQKALV